MIKKLKNQRNIIMLSLLTSLTFHLIFGLEGQAQIEELRYQNDKQSMRLKDKQEQIEVLEIILKNQEKDASKIIDEPEYVGTFEITYYTAGFESTDKTPDHPEYGITRSGTVVKEGRTIATDWDILPEGTKVYIDGVGERIVEDTGGLIKGECIDIFVNDVAVARQGGRHMADVWIVKEAD